MVQSKNTESLIYDVALSSVVPASITGEYKTHEFTNMDLAMKLHYINGVYFFQDSEIIKGLTISELKLPMFKLLEIYYPVSGRIRKDEDKNYGRPFIKCNDSGVRIVEANCSKTIDQFLALSLNDCVLNDQLVYHQVLGPDLGFSPLVLVQFTRFKCGGMSVGLSWSHVIGDAFSASDFINMWGQILAGQMPPNSIDATTKTEFTNAQSVGKSSISFALKKIEPVGDKWSISNNCNMKKCTFHISSKKMNNLLSKITEKSSSIDKFDPFEVISAVFWISLAKVRGELEPNIVTLCKKGSNNARKKVPIPISNSQMISIVKSADSSRIAETDVLELAKILAEKSVDETDLIEELVGEHRGGDFIVYGTNLTFVSMEELNIYGLELKGNKPDFGNYSFSGVGDEGVVMVLPGAENNTEKDGNGRIVNVILPGDQLASLKDELLKEWDIC
ncbi:hypothetical protein Leryth_015421 [Lithospermum erythrorhizon]|nr:hypothetical protein Leryth_015421 [Lithospermum erythrorhizon]